MKTSGTVCGIPRLRSRSLQRRRPTDGSMPLLPCFFSRPHLAAASCQRFPTFTLLSGPPRSGKTSLLLQFAFNSASESPSSTVVFICKRQNAERKPPALSEDVDASSEVLERVHMKYVDDDDDVRKYFAAFHLHDKMPDVIVIDDFYELFNDWKCKKLYGQSRGREISMIRTLALCRDAIDYANKVSNSNCKLLISDTHIGQGPRLVYIYQRWISTILTIEAVESGFILKNCRNDEAGERDTAYAHYMIRQHLKLESMGTS